MHSVGISIVKNEEDIIESFIRCNLRFLDGIVVFDNRSTDGTRNIIKALMQEGLPVCLSDDDDPAFRQSAKMTNFLRRVGSVISPEFIVPLDADEFIECRDRDEFQSILNTIPLNGCGIWKWKTYVLSPEDLARDQKDIIRPSQYKFCRLNELPQYSKVVIRASKDRIEGLVLSDGNHQLINAGTFPITELKDIYLAHFPVRGTAQIYKKSILGNFSHEIREKDEKKDRGRGYQKRDLYDRILKSEDFSGIALCNISLNYAQIPGDLRWPENTQKADGNLPDLENKYNTMQVHAEVLIEVVKDYHQYILGPSILFDPTDTYQMANTIREDVSSSAIYTAFEQDWHVKNISLDISPFRYLYDRFNPKSIFDIGCGLGSYMRLFENLGVDRTIGMDAIKSDVLFTRPENYILHDLVMSIDLKEKFDLVICTEAAQQLHPGTEDVLLANIDRHAENLILFSAAVPGQPGHGHINCRPFNFWADKWMERNWAPMLFETLGFRTLSTFSWLRRNSVLLSRTKNKIEALEKWAPFLQMSEKEYIYYEQQPEIITDPLAQSFQ